MFTVSLEMVLPGLAGVWLGGVLGWSPWLAIAGFAAGLVLGVWHLVVMTRPQTMSNHRDDESS